MRGRAETPEPTALKSCKKGLSCNVQTIHVEATHLSAPNHKSQTASDLKSRSPNRKNFPQIAVSGGSNRTFKSRDLKVRFEPLFKSPLESQCQFLIQQVRTMSFSEKAHTVSNRYPVLPFLVFLEFLVFFLLARNSLFF